MNPRQFLLIGGVILVLLGISGMYVLGPTPESSFLGNLFWSDDIENFTHLGLGFIAIAAYFLLKDPQLTRMLVLIIGVVGLVVAALGFLNSNLPVPNVGITNLENPTDNILHLVVGIWALIAGLVGEKSENLSDV